MSAYEESVIKYESSLNRASREWHKARPDFEPDHQTIFAFDGGFRMAHEQQASTIATLEAKCKELEAALTRIANPIKAFIEDAEKDGCKLDGHAAISLAKDAEILKQWATSALSSANSIGGCGCRFESEDSNTVILCDECSKLPCHNPTQQD